MAIAGLHNVSVLDSPFLRDSHSQASGRQADEARDIIAWLIFLFRILSLMIWPTFLLFACSVPNHRGKMKIQKEAWKKKKLRKLKNLFVLCPVNKLFRSYPIPSLQQQTIQKVSMLFFFFYSTTVSNCINYLQIIFPVLNVILLGSSFIFGYLLP